MGTAATTDDLTYLYNYDSLGRLMGSEEKRGGATTLRARQEYDEVSRLSGQSWQLGDKAYSESYTYNADDGSLDTMQTAVGQTLEMIYDGLQRLSSVKAGIYTRNYTYRDISATQTTPQVQKVSYSGLTDAANYAYLYDNSGRITRMTEANGDYWAYAYDNQGQMKYATDYSASGTGRARYKYTYDKAGNILSWQIQNGAETVVLESHTYTYGDANWKDLLTAFDGETISYDASGNPISYYNGTRWSFDWNEGRRLTSATTNGTDGTSGTSISYTYDGSGTRTTKTVDGVTHTYTYASGKLLRETYGNTTLDFCYDNTGRPFALTLTQNGTTATYYYITNLQGDVMSLVDSSGTAVAAYTYDPWGKVLTATGTLAEVNPIRYRGYYYDSETDFYYLQSRYYDPAICRFINADVFASTGQDFIGYNMFAYCGNSPVYRLDSCGEDYRTVGAGIQLDVSGSYGIATGGVGIEVIIFWDATVCGESDGPIVAAYVYNSVGASFDFEDLGQKAGDLTQLLLEHSDELQLDGATALDAIISTLTLEANVTVSGLLVRGNEDFKSSNDYTGGFNTISGNLFMIKGCYAWSDCCETYSVGYTFAGKGIGVARGFSDYYQLF